MEPVSERVTPITLKVAVYERDEPVTNVETVTFDSTSGNIDERKKWVPLVYGTAPTTKPRAIVSCCAMPTPGSSSPVSMSSLIGPLPMISETTALDTSLDDLLNQHFAGRVVRKDLTKLVKEGANVPVYVLEYLGRTVPPMTRK